jgi:protocatechuate 3,4-dioxygenase beta subunit
VVEIWHTDASGDYSAFADGGGGKDEAGGTTFLRGSQTADDEGIIEFHTIYPGWYRGRAVHIHVRVHVDDATVLTSQLYFDEAYTESVFASGVYAEFGSPDTSNEADTIAGDPASDGSLLTTTAAETAAGAGTLGLLNLGIEPRA